MALDMENSPYLQSLPRSHAQDGLGYSRHYAQRIRDLGRTSKDSWIKRLWNHMFQGNKKNDKSQQQQQHSPEQQGSPKQQRTSSGNRSTQLPPITTNQKSTSQQPPAVRQGGTKQVTFSGDISSRSDRDGSRSAPARGREKPGGGPDVNLASGKTIPAQLADSPYIPAREKSKYTWVLNLRIRWFYFWVDLFIYVR